MVVDRVGGVARTVGQVPCAYIYVDGARVATITDDGLKDRRIFVGCWVNDTYRRRPMIVPVVRRAAAVRPAPAAAAGV